MKARPQVTYNATSRKLIIVFRDSAVHRAQAIPRPPFPGSTPGRGRGMDTDIQKMDFVQRLTSLPGAWQ
jgi:hypothetical protein